MYVSLGPTAAIRSIFDGHGGIEVRQWLALSAYDGGVVNNGGHAERSAHVEDFLIELYDLGEIFILSGIFDDPFVSPE